MDNIIVSYVKAILFFGAIAFILLPSVGASPCDFFRIFNSSDSYKLNPRPFWLLSEDPLQPEPHRITKWTINSDVIFVSHGWSIRDFREVAFYKLYCVENPTENSHKILLRMNKAEESGTGKFVCMELTLRSPIIFQVKLSGVATSTAPPTELCLKGSLVDKGMTFVNFQDSSGWADYIKGLVQYVTCPLNGGYTITSWQDETGTSKCLHPQAGNLRVEDECENGEGIVFSKGVTQDCKNPVFGEIYQNDALRCFSKWSDEEYDYAVALTNYPTSAYCIRVPRKMSVQMEVYIFKDGICDYTSDIRYSKKFLKMELLQHTIPTTCDDVSPWCGSTTLDTEDKKNLCAATAGACRNKPLFWEDLTTPTALQGNWYRETEALGTANMEIGGQTIRFTHSGIWKFAGEVSCSLDTYGLQEKGTFYLLISMADNGCRPRVAVLWVMPFSKSVLGMQLSHSTIASPLVNDTFALTPEALCRLPGLYFGNYDLLGDRYHVSSFGWYNLVNTDESLPLAECDIRKWRKMQVTLQEGQSCAVTLKQEGPNSFSVTVESCNKVVNGLALNKPIQHDCMAQYKGRYGWTSYLITKTPQDQTNLGKRQYICWLFSNEKPRGLIMPIGDCNDETDGEVTDSKSKIPLAKISLTSPTASRSGLLLPSTLLTIICYVILQLTSRT